MTDLFDSSSHHLRYSYENYSKRSLFLSLLCAIIVACVAITLLIKCLVLVWTKLCRRQQIRREDADPNKRSTSTATNLTTAEEDSNLNLNNVVVVQDMYVNPYCRDGTHGHSGAPGGERPYSVFQFNTDDIDLAFAVQAIQPARRPEITKAAQEEIIVEALKQRRRQTNPLAKASTLNKRPSDEAIFDIEMQLLNPNCLAGSLLERKYSFFTNIYKMQRAVEEVWEALDQREPFWLNTDERWVCRLMLEANRDIDRTMGGGHCTNPDMMCALAFVDAPQFITPRPPSRRGNHHAMCVCDPGPARRPTPRSTRSRFKAEMERPPPRFETVMAADEDEPPPPSYDDVCMGAEGENVNADAKAGLPAADSEEVDKTVSLEDENSKTATCETTGAIDIVETESHT